MDAPVEALLITGLPGSGRSTLLADLLRSLRSSTAAESPGCAVCVHRHARAFGLETLELAVAEPPCVYYSEVYDFGSGCLCCSPDGDLARLLAELGSQRQKLGLRHLLLETTGVADPRPFVALFERQQLASQSFRLAGVVCTVDLVRAPALLARAGQAGCAGTAARGATQLQEADLLVLTKGDELHAVRSDDFDAEVCSVQELALSLAFLPADPARHADDGPALSSVQPAVLRRPSEQMTCSDSLSYVALRRAMEEEPVRRRQLIRQAERVTAAPAASASLSSALPYLAFGPPGGAAGFGVGHDASCETACLVLPRGGVCLDAALAMLQMLLDSGDALRIQGYVSFFPADLEPGPAAREPQSGLQSMFPSLELTWGLPMVVVEGICRRVRSYGPLVASSAVRLASLGLFLASTW